MEASLTSPSLLRRARLRDPQAWQQLCQIYAPLVYCWIRKKGIASQDTPDIVQEVFRAVAAHLEQFRSDRPGDTFRGWLITITQREILSFFRRSAKTPCCEGGTTAVRRLQNIADESAQSAETDPSPNSEDDRRFVVMRAAEVIRGDFAEHTWQAFWRTVVDQTPIDMIAAELKMTPNAVRQSKFRVLSRLRETLADNESFVSGGQEKRAEKRGQD